MILFSKNDLLNDIPSLKIGLGNIFCLYYSHSYEKIVLNVVYYLK